jgi:hypothetical protein
MGKKVQGLRDGEGRGQNREDRRESGKRARRANFISHFASEWDSM